MGRKTLTQSVTQLTQNMYYVLRCCVRSKIWCLCAAWPWLCNWS